MPVFRTRSAEAVANAVIQLETAATSAISESPFAANSAEVARQYAENPLAKALVDLPASWLTSGPVTLKADSEAAQARIDEFWADPISDWASTLPRLIREQTLFGEAAIGVFEQDGMVRIGRISPRTIDRIVADPANLDRNAVAIRTLDNAEEETWAVGLSDDGFSEAAARARATAVGKIIILPRNRLTGQLRGSSDLKPVITWLNLYEQLVAGELDRMAYMRAFIWDVQLPDESKLKERQKAVEASPPGPGSIIIHGPNETWTPQSPSIGGADAADAARIFRNHILSVMQVPEHFLGGGGDINRATAAEMDSPFIKQLLARQREWTGLITLLASRVAPGAKIEVQWPALVQEDETRHAQAFKHSIDGLVAAVNGGLIDRAEGRFALAQWMPEGFDPAAELMEAEDAEQVTDEPAPPSRRGESDNSEE